MTYRRRKNRKGIRGLAALLALVLLLGSFSGTAVPVTAATLEDAWDGVSMSMPSVDENGFYQIYTAKELAWFADQVNQGQGKINGRLEDTIYLNNSTSRFEWVLIGNDEEHPFRGIFDGNGFSVNYLYASSSEQDSGRRYIGLFGVIDGGVVRNLKVSGNLLQGYGNSGSADSLNELAAGSGGIAGYLKAGTIYACQNYVKTTMTGTTRYRNTGGIAGISAGGILHCTNYGKISTAVAYAQRHVGGIAGLVTGPGASVRYSLNRADVQGYFEVGGVAGAVKYGAEVRASANYGAVSGNEIIGGIAGMVTRTGTLSNGSAKECGIYDVYNIGAVSGFGDHQGDSIGGIVGFLGYASWAEAELPCMPAVENAYSTAMIDKVSFKMHGAAVGQFRSGSIGNLYCLKGGSAEMVGAQENKVTSYSSTIAFRTSANMKKQAFADQLGAAFVKVTSFEADTKGYPKLAWQKQTSDLSAAVDAAVLELNSWLTESNRSLYGKNYSKIEELVSVYLRRLDQVTEEEEPEQIMEAARKALGAVKPGKMADEERYAAIDEALSAFGEYYDKVLAEHPELTDAQKEELQEERKKAEDRIRKGKTDEEIEAALEDGKNILDEKLAAFAREEDLEEIRAGYIKTLSGYEAESDYGEEWNNRIAEVRNAGIAELEAAETTADADRIFSEAKRAIDNLIASVPSADAWDGSGKREPAKDSNNVYLITTAEELAWFADRINNGNDQTLCARLQNDIHLGGREWTPIGTEENVFRGRFDGGGYTIRGLSVTEAEGYAGLFGRVYGTDGKSISDLTVYGLVQVSRNVTYAGGIVGYCSGQNENTRNAVTNCRSYVDVTLSGITRMNSSAGGIAGYAKYTWFRECENNGNVSIPSTGKGGITYFAGGVLGQASAGTTVRRSCNNGNVEAANCAGGLVGRVMEMATEFTSNYNRGTVYADVYAGGLAGLIEATAVDASFRYSYSSGAVNPGRTAKYRGALFGNMQAGGCEEVYALKRADQTDLDLVGYTADNSSDGQYVSEQKLQSDAMLNTLNVGGSYFIRDYLFLQEGYPMFGWQMTIDQFRDGAVRELRSFVSEEEYTEENWEKVSSLIDTGCEQLADAGSFDRINEILTETKEAVYAIESLEEVRLRELDAAKQEALEKIEVDYSDRSAYREKEQMQIETLVTDAKQRIYKTKTIEQLQEIMDTLADKIERLKTDAQYLEEEEKKAVNTVIAAIGQIGEVELDPAVLVTIQTARNLYDQLSEERKEKVTNYEILIAAEEKWQQMMEEAGLTEEDLDSAAVVDQLIEEKLANKAITKKNEDDIRQVRAAYDSLTDNQKLAVRNLPVLQKAETDLNRAYANEVINAIASLGNTITLDSKADIEKARTAYDALSAEQKELVTDYPVLKAAEETVMNLEKAAKVEELIGDIGTVTEEKAAEIQAAVKAYNDYRAWLEDPKREWSSKQTDQVSNYKLLDAAVKELQSVKKIRDAENSVEQIGSVNAASRSLIEKARKAYDALGEGEKAKFSSEKLKMLLDAERAFEALNKADEEPDGGNTGGTGGTADNGSDNAGGDSSNTGDAAGSSEGNTSTAGGSSGSNVVITGEDADYYYGYTYTQVTSPRTGTGIAQASGTANASDTAEQPSAAAAEIDEPTEEQTSSEELSEDETEAAAVEKNRSAIAWDTDPRASLKENDRNLEEQRTSQARFKELLIRHPFLWILVLILFSLTTLTVFMFVMAKKAEEKRNRRRVLF
ncbi:MAG: hypothetical protein Q4B22_00485 [Eubacteriales bacterium]|nr:hypothetical protein [Eubacteriales bacterium]